MEIFIALKKYNTRQRREEGKPQLVMTSLSAYYPNFTIVSNVFMRNETYLLMFIGTEYNKYIIYIDKIIGQIGRLISKIKNITLSLGQRWDREVWNFRESGHWDQKVFVLSHTYIISCNSVYMYIYVIYMCVCVCVWCIQ